MKKKFKVDFYLVLLSIIFSLFFNKQVNEMVDFMLPKTTIKLKMLEDEEKGIVLLQLDKKIDFKKLKKFNRENIEFIPEGQYGYNTNALWIKNNKELFEMKIKKDPKLKISFYNIGSKKIEISSGKNIQIIDLKNTKDVIFDYFPFRESKLFFIYTVVVYFLLSIFIYTGIVFFFFKKKSREII